MLSTVYYYTDRYVCIIKPARSQLCTAPQFDIINSCTFLVRRRVCVFVSVLCRQSKMFGSCLPSAEPKRQDEQETHLRQTVVAAATAATGAGAEAGV